MDYTVLGSVLPDLTGIFGRVARERYAEKLEKKRLERFDPTVAIKDQRIVRYERDNPGYHITNGIINHLKVDTVFHNSDFFTEQREFIKSELENLNLVKGPRYLHFVTHIVLELMLDRLLIKENDGICDEFYTHLQKIEKEALILYLNEHDYVQVDNEFFDFFQRFVSSRYLHTYTHNEHFIFALNRIIRLPGLSGFEDSDNNNLSMAITKIELGISSHYKTIFDEINSKLDENLLRNNTSGSSLRLIA